ncbi:HNH endonuclease [Solibaculum intestinale]|uniref:Putative HNH nuclease YajD n=1 Tax=Solibaculum intestinale TaxID=3133165 RepID=A0ABV1E3X3_9FIRM
MQLIADDNIHAFYVSPLWLKVSAEVLKEQHYECQRCKKRGRYKRANTVHHNKPVRQYPRLALTKDHLEAICKECHYEEHHGQPKGFVNEERW